MARSLVFPDALVAELLQAAARAYPEECCGLIEGADTAEGWRISAIHAAANVAANRAARFLIDPQIQFDLMRRLRGGQTRIIGCYHSHPDGEASPSATDLSEAWEPGFLYLIAGGGPDSFTLNAHLFDEGRFSKLTLS